MNSRGLSPLVATVLLIAFSVALGAVVMSYGETYVETQATFVNRGTEVSSNVCDAVSLTVITVNNNVQACAKGTLIQVALDNGPVAIDAIQARVLGSAGVALNPNILSNSLPAASALKTTFGYDPVCVPLQLKFTPAVQTEAGLSFCSDKAVTIDNPSTC